LLLGFEQPVHRVVQALIGCLRILALDHRDSLIRRDGVDA
jgi:hypothetical protein